MEDGIVQHTAQPAKDKLITANAINGQKTHTP